MAFGIPNLFSGAGNLLAGRGKLIALGAIILAVIGTITYQQLSIDNLESQVRAIEAEKRMQAATCNERITGMIAASQDVALKAQAEAVLKERAEWQLRIDASLKSAAIAAESRTAAELEANELQRRLDQVYKESQDAENWRNTAIPDAIIGLRD